MAERKGQPTVNALTAACRVFEALVADREVLKYIAPDQILTPDSEAIEMEVMTREGVVACATAFTLIFGTPPASPSYWRVCMSRRARATS